MFQTMVTGRWRGLLRGLALLAFGGILAFAIWQDVSAGGPNAVQGIEARWQEKRYDDAMHAAQVAVRQAHAEALAACGAREEACRLSAREAARAAGLAALNDAGCIAWEMAGWRASRPSPDRPAPKSRAEAEAACAAAAAELAERMSAWSARQPPERASKTAAP